MTIKEILDDFNLKEEQEKKHWKELQEQTAQQIEARIERLNRCFEEVILPSVRKVEKDLQGFGLWHKIHVGQTTSPNTGRPNRVPAPSRTAWPAAVSHSEVGP